MPPKRKKRGLPECDLDSFAHTVGFPEKSTPTNSSIPFSRYSIAMRAVRIAFSLQMMCSTRSVQTLTAINTDEQANSDLLCISLIQFMKCVQNHIDSLLFTQPLPMRVLSWRRSQFCVHHVLFHQIFNHLAYNSLQYLFGVDEIVNDVKQLKATTP